TTPAALSTGTSLVSWPATVTRRSPSGAAAMRLGGELAGLADLLVEDGRGHVAAELADTASEGSGRVSQLRTCVGGRGDDDLAHDGGIVAGPHRGGGQHVESFAASRVQRKRLIDRDGVRVERS